MISRYSPFIIFNRLWTLKWSSLNINNFIKRYSDNNKKWNNLKLNFLMNLFRILSKQLFLLSVVVTLYRFENLTEVLNIHHKLYHLCTNLWNIYYLKGSDSRFKNKNVKWRMRLITIPYDVGAWKSVILAKS